MNTIMDEMLHELINGVAENPNNLNIIDAVLKHQLSGIEQRRGISFQIIAEIISLGDKKLNEKVYIKLIEYLSRVRTFLADGVRINSIRNDIDLDAASLLLFGMIQGVVNIWALSNYDFDLTAKYESLWPIYQKAIQTQEQKETNIGIEKNYKVLSKAQSAKKYLNRLALHIT
jgi:hypothetical protein